MRRLSSIVLAALFMAAIMLSSCSGDGTANAVPFSETVSGDGIRIWYECQNKIEEPESDATELNDLFPAEDEKASSEPVEYGRETRVVWIRVYQNGKLSTYSTLKNVYLGYFAKMTDEEIIKALDTETDTFICARKDEPFEIYLYSDASGHEIMFEGVPTIIQVGEKNDPMYFMTLVSNETISTFQVYDSYYGGYVLYNYDETPFGEAVLITRCDEGAVFGLDALDLEGAVVDYATPEDMLHEKNDALEEEKKASKKANKDSEKQKGDGAEEAADGDAAEDAEGETETP